MSYLTETNDAINTLKSNRKFEQFFVTINDIKDAYGLDNDYIAESVTRATRAIELANKRQYTTKRRKATKTVKYFVNPESLPDVSNPKSDYNRKFETDLR